VTQSSAEEKQHVPVAGEVDVARAGQFAAAIERVVVVDRAADLILDLAG
jgi:anti-anti-sigma regulatory factor